MRLGFVHRPMRWVCRGLIASPHRCLVCLHEPLTQAFTSSPARVSNRILGLAQVLLSCEGRVESPRRVVERAISIWCCVDVRARPNARVRSSLHARQSVLLLKIRASSSAAIKHLIKDLACHCVHPSMVHFWRHTAQLLDLNQIALLCRLRFRFLLLLHDTGGHFQHRGCVLHIRVARTEPRAPS